MSASKPSKSERKREQQRLQSLGEQLLQFDDAVLASLQLGERLREALGDAQKMKSHEALRRQKQYIGKLMRDVDPAPIEAHLNELRADERRAKRVFAAAERWRDRVMREGATGIAALFEDIDEQPDSEDRRNSLLDLQRELEHVSSDRQETELKRRLFRQIHAALVVAAKDR